MQLNVLHVNQSSTIGMVLEAFIHFISCIIFQAIEIRSCCTRPIDQDIEWSCAANQLIHELIFEKVQSIRIEFSEVSWS